SLEETVKSGPLCTFQSDLHYSSSWLCRPAGRLRSRLVAGCRVGHALSLHIASTEMTTLLARRTATTLCACAVLVFASACDQQQSSETTLTTISYSSFDSRVDSLLAQMTLAEKIGQMTQVDHEFLQDPAHIQEYFLGSILNGGGSDPAEGNTLEAW